MSRLRHRLSRMERELTGPGRIFFTTISSELPEDQHTAFLEAERERQAVGDADIHFVTIYEPEPKR